MKNFSDFLEAYNKRKSSNAGPFAVVTLSEARGSTPQDIGARIITDANGLCFGTVGGGKVEAKCIALVQEKLKQNELSTFHIKWNLQKDVGMTCGGEVSFLIEFHSAESLFQITVYGAGHVAQELVPLLCKLDAQVNVFDTREEWIQKFPRLKNLNTTVHENLPETAKLIAPKSFVILMTMGHSSDFPILKEILKRDDLPYVGVIGSLQKKKIMVSELKNLNYPEEKINSFKCPIGLDIGSNDPFEIAISVIAEVIQQKQGN